MPTRPRGHETRAALIAAAREVFERDGFLGARITDIAAAANVATGSFYTYFKDKDELFAVLMQQTYEQLFESAVLALEPDHDPAARIEEAVRSYLDAYRRNARLRKLMEEVANIDDRFFQILLQRSLSTVRQNAAAIRRLQVRGLADPTLDPELASLALGAMGSRFAYTVFCGNLPYQADIGAMVATLTRIWVNALGLTTSRTSQEPWPSALPTMEDAMSTTADPRVDAYIEALPEWQQAICREVRDLVHAADPEVVETIKRTDRPYFVLNGNICALLAAKDHVDIFLYDGGIVPDPEGIITGGHDNKTARMVAVGRSEAVNKPALAAMFRQIIANNRAGGWRRLKRDIQSPASGKG